MKQDYIVIGAGIIGLATAQGLLAQGATVTVLERGKAGGESSWAGGGILSPLCPWDYPDEVTRLTRYSADLFSAWAKDLYATTGIDPEYQTSGMLVLPPFNSQLAQQWCTTHAVTLHEVKVDDYAPHIGGDALYLPEVAHVRNPRLLRALQKRVTMLGGRIVEHCAVSGLISDAGQVQALATSCGQFSADKYIVAAGAWSREVLGKYALQLDIKPVRGQMLLYKFAAPPLRTIVLQHDLYLIPRRDGYVLIGSTLEEVGFDKQPTEAARADLFQRAQKILPQLHNMPLMQHWAGLRPGSPGNIPTIARHPHLNNLYINSGHFRYGVTMAPASVEILLNEIQQKTQTMDITPYRAGWGPR